MAEYIERVPFSELVEHLDKKEPCKNCYHRAACDAWVRNATTQYDDYDYSVENCPYHIQTADVAEVRHGEWIKYPHNSGIYCSRCRHKRRYKDANDNYCPNCGADMRGVEDGR